MNSALDIARHLGDKSNESRWLGALTYSYSNTGDMANAIKYGKRALKIAREIHDRRREAACLGNLGNAFANSGQPQKALK